MGGRQEAGSSRTDDGRKHRFTNDTRVQSRLTSAKGGLAVGTTTTPNPDSRQHHHDDIPSHSTPSIRTISFHNVTIIKKAHTHFHGFSPAGLYPTPTATTTPSPPHLPPPANPHITPPYYHQLTNHPTPPSTPVYSAPHYPRSPYPSPTCLLSYPSSSSGPRRRRNRPRMPAGSRQSPHHHRRRRPCSPAGTRCPGAPRRTG